MRIIWLTKGQFTLVDDADYEYLSQWKWWVSVCKGVSYAMRTGRESGIRKDVIMHREILGIKDPKLRGDHIDRNGLNNQRKNLRVATHGENNANSKPRKNKTSQFRGVSWFERDKRWTAHITKDKVSYYLGNFTDQQSAAIAYNKKAIEFHGEFATLNNVNL